MNDTISGFDWRVEAALKRLIFNVAAAREVLLEEGYFTLVGQLERDARTLERWLKRNKLSEAVSESEAGFEGD